MKPDTDVVAVMDGLRIQFVLGLKGFDMPGRLRAHADRLLRAIAMDGTGLTADV